MPDLGYPLSTGKWDAVLQGETAIAAGVFQTFLRCIRQMGGASDSIYQPLMGHTCTFPPRSTAQVAHKMPDLGYPLSTANGMLYYKERQPLLLEYFITFLRCIRQIGGASEQHLPAPYVSHHVIFHQVQLSNGTQNARFGVPSQYGKWDAVLQ